MRTFAKEVLPGQVCETGVKDGRGRTNAKVRPFPSRKCLPSSVHSIRQAGSETSSAQGQMRQGQVATTACTVWRGGVWVTLAWHIAM